MYDNVYLCMLINFVAITVKFNQSTYTVNEHQGPVQPILTLSRASPCCITIRAILKDITATG